MKIGIIGTGCHGSRYAEHLIKDCKNLQLAAISRRSGEGAHQAAGWQTRWFEHWAELIEAAETEAVICAVPPALHLAIATLCSRYGKPLLIEKPLAINYQDGAAIVSVMQEQQVPLTVGQTLRYHPVIRTLRDQLPQLGQLFSAYANQRLEPATSGWLEAPQEAGAGITFDRAVHVFDALHFITGLKVQRVSAMCRVCKTKHLEDLALIHVEMEQGVAGIVDISKLSTSRSGRFEFIGEKSQLHGDQIQGQVSIIKAHVESPLATLQPMPTIPALLDDWAAFLRGEQENPVTGEDSLYAIRVSEASLESSEDSRWVNV